MGPREECLGYTDVHQFYSNDRDDQKMRKYSTESCLYQSALQPLCISPKHKAHSI